MKINYKLLPAILLATIYLQSCKKEEAPKEIPVIKFSAEALAYVELPLNRYFIYKDSATQILDSVVVTESKTEMLYRLPQGGGSLYFNFSMDLGECYYQVFNLTLTKFNGAVPEVWLSAKANSNRWENFYARDSASMDLNQVFWHPFLHALVETPHSVIFTSQVVIEGKTYYNPVVFLNHNGRLPGDANYRRSVYYWVKGLGIIKREIQTGNLVKTELLVRNN